MSPLVAHESTRKLLDAWVQDLAPVIESMTDRPPAVHWKPASGTAEAVGVSGPETSYSYFKIFCPQEAGIWIAAPAPTSDRIGKLTLQAAGLEESNPEEIRKTWREIVSQWVSSLARSLGSYLGHEVASEDAGEQPPEGQHDWLMASLRIEETDLPAIAVALSPALVKALSLSPHAEYSPADSGEHEAAPPPVASRTLELLMDVELPVSISFGKTELPLKDVLKLTTGSIVELNRGINEPVELLVNHRLVARGEVVVMEGNYALRIQQIASRQDRLRSIR
ncbi:MAG TPA: flagellar motor switch protein FliN [Bryobacteraceae bacterium]|nr:flagellar motor switch protein FliN [Bryobacteraceae bacterium]